jgi:hypothetical protein
MILKASKIEYTRLDLENGLIVEIKIWKLPFPTDERLHGLKHSLFLGGIASELWATTMRPERAITAIIEPKKSHTLSNRWSSCSLISGPM